MVDKDFILAISIEVDDVQHRDPVPHLVDLGAFEAEPGTERRIDHRWGRLGSERSAKNGENDETREEGS